MADYSGYKYLANAIVIQAANDYRELLRILRQHPNDKDALFYATDIEEFFQSDWYAMLTDVDGMYIIRKIRREVYGK